MTTTEIVDSGTGITFDKQINGYNREQVERYVTKLAGAYQSAYEENNSVNAKYDDLLEEYEKLMQEQSDKPGQQVIAKVLIDAQTLAQKIIGDANEEAMRIRDEAQSEAKKAMEEAYVEKVAANIQARQLISDAETKAAAVKEAAGKVMNEVDVQARKTEARAKASIEQANAKIASMINEMQDMLTGQISNAA